MLYIIAQKLVWDSVAPGLTGRFPWFSRFLPYRGIAWPEVSGGVNPLAPTLRLPENANTVSFSQTAALVPELTCHRKKLAQELRYRKWNRDGKTTFLLKHILGFFDGDKSADIDLNFSSEIPSPLHHRYTEELLSDGTTCLRQERSRRWQKKRLMATSKKYLGEKGTCKLQPYRGSNRLGQSAVPASSELPVRHPGGKVARCDPCDYDVIRLSHRYKHAGRRSGVRNSDQRILTLHSLQDTILKLDELGHVVPNHCIQQTMEDKTRTSAIHEVPTTARRSSRMCTMPLFSGNSRRDPPLPGPGRLGDPGNVVSGFTIQMLLGLQTDKSSADFLQVQRTFRTVTRPYGLVNAKDLIDNGTWHPISGRNRTYT